LFALPGAPCLYYGTELGLHGGPEPACREAFPWRAILKGRQAVWWWVRAGTLRSWSHFCGNLRAQRGHHPALRGDCWRLRELRDGSDGCWGVWLGRWQGFDRVHLIFNRSHQTRVVLEMLWQLADLGNHDGLAPSVGGPAPAVIPPPDRP